MNGQQPTQGEVVKQVLQARSNKLVTYKQLMDAAGIDTRQRLQFIVKKLVERKQLPIEMVRRDGYVYRE